MSNHVKITVEPTDGVTVTDLNPPFYPTDTTKRTGGYWHRPPLYWIQFLRWTYALGVLPLKVTWNGSRYVVTTCKIRQGLRIGSVVLYTIFLVATFRNATTCENYIAPMTHLFVNIGDLIKSVTPIYVFWYKREAVERALNSSLFDQTSAKNSRVSLPRKAWIWIVVLGYPLQAYGVIVLLDFCSFEFSNGFYELSDPFLNCKISNTDLAPGKFSISASAFDWLWLGVYCLQMIYINLTDAFILATIGSYGELADILVSELAKISSPEDCDCKSTEETLEDIEKFQLTIREINASSEAVTSAWFFANLPFHVIKGIPLASPPLNQGIFIFIIARTYTMSFYLSIGFAAIKSSKVANAVRSWISRVKRNHYQKHSELQLLYMEANGCQDFALNLYGLGSLNSTLVLSTISATVTYTILNYQLNLYKNV